MFCWNVKSIEMSDAAPESAPLMDRDAAASTTASTSTTSAASASATTYTGSRNDVPFRFHYFTQGDSSIWNCCS